MTLTEIHTARYVFLVLLFVLVGGAFFLASRRL